MGIRFAVFIPLLCYVCPSLQVLKKYPRLWCMTKPPSRRPKLYIVNLQVTWVLTASSLFLGVCHICASRESCTSPCSWRWLTQRAGDKQRAGGSSHRLSCLQWTPKDDWAALKLHGKCDDVMQLLMDELGLEIPVYSR